jgi:hypothetical protein
MVNHDRIAFEECFMKTTPAAGALGAGAKGPVVARSAEMSTNCVIPFNVKRQVALELFRSWLRSLWFAPSDLDQAVQIKECRSIFLPYWLFEVEVFSNVLDANANPVDISHGTPQLARRRSSSNAASSAASALGLSVLSSPSPPPISPFAVAVPPPPPPPPAPPQAVPVPVPMPSSSVPSAFPFSSSAPSSSPSSWSSIAFSPAVSRTSSGTFLVGSPSSASVGSGSGSSFLRNSASRHVVYRKYSDIMVPATAPSRNSAPLQLLEPFKLEDLQPFTLHHAQEHVDVRSFLLNEEAAFNEYGKPKIEKMQVSWLVVNDLHTTV